MKFSCDQCGNLFTFRNNLYRHKTKTCKGGQNPHLNPVTPHPVSFVSSSFFVTPHLNSVTPHLNPVTPHHLNSVTPHNKVIVKCLKCMKHITRSNFARHLRNCKGCPSNTCRFCGESFKTNSNISRHEKTCNDGGRKELVDTIITTGETISTISRKECLPHPSSSSSSTNQNIHNQNITINNNIVNNNIVLNLFGVESWDYLIKICNGENKSEFEKLKTQLLTEGIDGLCKLIECHYFNKDYPQNQTIRKKIKNNDFVEVHVGNNEWEPKTLDTAMEEIKHTTSMYIRPFVDDVIQSNYHIDQNIHNKLNNTFVDILAPLQYDMCSEYYHQLSGLEEPNQHIVKQKEQISKRKIKAMLFEFSSTKL